MKKLFYIIMILMVMSSCMTTKEAKSTRIELRKNKNLAEQTVIKKAVESRRFIIRFDRVYYSHGGRVDLVPRANYIIIDGDRAIISAAYLGRQYGMPIAAIDMIGKSMNYELSNDSSDGAYKIKMDVGRGGDNSFDVNLTISKNGFCNVSVSSLRIDFVRYSGRIVPIKDKINIPLQESIVI
ncbi:MAG: DUF4251 domain-containing protein [Bacteroidia bacterium]|nr:DUF4251 domain-containing protein [Bacteroidia bacterium]